MAKLLKCVKPYIVSMCWRLRLIGGVLLPSAFFLLLAKYSFAMRATQAKFQSPLHEFRPDLVSGSPSQIPYHHIHSHTAYEPNATKF